MSVGFHPDPGRAARLARLKADAPPPRVLVTRPAKPKPCRDWLKLAGEHATDPKAWAVVHCVAAETQVARAEIISSSRYARPVFARSIAAWLLREHTILSSTQIGVVLGGRDHSTILHAVRRVKSMIDRNAALMSDDWRSNLVMLATFDRMPHGNVRPPRSASSSAGERG